MTAGKLRKATLANLFLLACGRDQLHVDRHLVSLIDSNSLAETLIALKSVGVVIGSVIDSLPSKERVFPRWDTPHEKGSGFVRCGVEITPEATAIWRWHEGNQGS